MSSISESVISGVAFVGHLRTEEKRPSEYRLGLRNGVPVLQGRFVWTEGSMSGFSWRDLPTFDLDAEEDLATTREVPIRKHPPINALDFGVPAEFAERAESYVRWAVAMERNGDRGMESSCR